MPLAEQLKELVPALSRCFASQHRLIVKELTEFIDAYVRTSTWLPASKQQVYLETQIHSQLWRTKMHGFYDDQVHGSCGAEHTTQS